MNISEDRRIEILSIDPGHFMMLFEEGLKLRQGYKIIKGVPKDAQLLGCAMDPKTGGVVLVLYSKEFKQVPEGEKFPTRQVILRV